jgi:hypothetical protein
MQNSQEFITDILEQENPELAVLTENLPAEDSINAEPQVDVATDIIDEVDNTQIETEQLVEETNSLEDETPTQEPVKELTEIEKLTNRRTGFWQVNLDISDLKWIKNSCQNKFDFNGPNEAFMLMNCYLGFAAAVARQEDAVKQKLEASIPAVQASAIEACALMLNKYVGSGLETAQRIFRIAIALNGIIMEMQTLDKMIAELKTQNAQSETK